MKRSELVVDSIDLLHYQSHKISLNRGRSYTDSPKWLKSKEGKIQPKNSFDNML